ncbi:hypothetical protein BDW66DRAFT_48029 [Aspergillus desertorum]
MFLLLLLFHLSRTLSFFSFYPIHNTLLSLFSFSLIIFIELPVLILNPFLYFLFSISALQSSNASYSIHSLNRTNPCRRTLCLASSPF